MSGRGVAALAALAAVVLAFGLAFVAGRSSKRTAAAAAPVPQLRRVALSEARPKITPLETSGTLPALVKPKPKPKPQPVPQPRPQPRPQPQPQPQPQPRPQPQPQPQPSGGGGGGGGSTGGQQ